MKSRVVFLFGLGCTRGIATPAMKDHRLDWIPAVAAFLTLAMNSSSAQQIKTNPLTPAEARVILEKGTEAPFSGKYDKFAGKGFYTCKHCDAILFRSSDKFDSGCGWPSFDDAIPGAVKKTPDADGRRTEITCNRCGGHLGHVFSGERFTAKNTRHCVNSVSLNFVPEGRAKIARAWFAAGCFWGVQYHFDRADGVVASTAGYMGGTTRGPTYRQVCAGGTGHLEALEVVFDPLQTSYEQLARLFFEIHDPTQADGQGPDIGGQYLSAIFYLDEEQRQTAEKLAGVLKSKGLAVVTKLLPAAAAPFWRAEEYHQHYYDRTGKLPYCHARTRRF